MKQTWIAVGTLLFGIMIAQFYPSALTIFGFDRKKSSPEEENKTKTIRLFTREELKKYSGKGKLFNGTDSLKNKPIYLALVGHVFDVTKGREYYGEGGGYSFFSGIDGTRAFVSGNFTTDGLIDSIDDFDDDQISGIRGWVEFYKEKSEGKYFHVGYLIGTYFDQNGKATAAYQMYLDRVEEVKKNKDALEQERKIWPTCDSRWEQGKGKTVSCMNGKLPRELTLLDDKNSKKDMKNNNARCACVTMDQNPPVGKKLMVYPGCSPNDSLCKVSEE